MNEGIELYNVKSVISAAKCFLSSISNIQGQCGQPQ